MMEGGGWGLNTLHESLSPKIFTFSSSTLIQNILDLVNILETSSIYVN